MFFCGQKIDFERGYKKPVGMDQDKTSGIKASCNKGIQIVVGHDQILAVVMERITMNRANNVWFIKNSGC